MGAQQQQWQQQRVVVIEGFYEKKNQNVQDEKLFESSRLFYLFPVHDFLGEDAIVVADAVAVGSHAEGGHGVKEASGQAAKASVAKAGILFHVL